VLLNTKIFLIFLNFIYFEYKIQKFFYVITIKMCIYLQYIIIIITRIIFEEYICLFFYLVYKTRYIININIDRI